MTSVHKIIQVSEEIGEGRGEWMVKEGIHVLKKMTKW